MRPLHITKSVECLISSHQSTFSCLFSNMEFYFLTVLLQIGSYFCTAISTQESLHIIYTTLLLNKPSSPFPVANTHPQLLLKLHPDFGVCHIHLPSVPCDTLSVFVPQGLDLECIARAKLSIIQTHFSHSLVHHDLMLRYLLYIQKTLMQLPQ